MTVRRAITVRDVEKTVYIPCKFPFVSVKLACNLHSCSSRTCEIFRDISSDNGDRKTGYHHRMMTIMLLVKGASTTVTRIVTRERSIIPIILQELFA